MQTFSIHSVSKTFHHSAVSQSSKKYANAERQKKKSRTFSFHTGFEALIQPKIEEAICV